MFSRLLHAFGARARALGGAPRRGRRAVPGVSALEGRSLLSVDLGAFPNGAPLYVTELFADLMQRVPNPAELNTWVTVLHNGGTPAGVAKRLVTSTEHRAVEVQQFYQTYLNRPADTSGLIYQVGLLNSGVSPVDVQLGFINSPQFQAAHATNRSYVDALYADILGRPADAAGEAYWDGLLNRGAMTRGAVASAFFHSQEYATLIIQRDFNLVLAHGATPGAIQFWTPVLAHDRTDDTLLVSLFSSDENLLNIKRLAG